LIEIPPSPLKKGGKTEIEQVIIFLQPSTSEIVFKTQYVDTKTRHEYRVIRLWEEDPAPLLVNPALLLLAALARSDSPNALLEQVAAQVDMIEESDKRTNISACIQVLAGLRFDKDLIQQLFREEIMQESVIYQDILQKGEQRGKQQGEVTLILRQMNRRFGSIDSEIERRINGLSTNQLENLAEALLDFSTQADLISWLDSHL
jgi:predicted transposase YdaD